MSKSIDLTQRRLIQVYIDTNDGDFTVDEALTKEQIDELVEKEGHDTFDRYSERYRPDIDVACKPGAITLCMEADGFRYYHVVVLRVKNGFYVQEDISEDGSDLQFYDHVEIDDVYDGEAGNRDMFMSGYACLKHSPTSRLVMSCKDCYEEQRDFGFQRPE